jgi:hypothetical protein
LNPQAKPLPAGGQAYLAKKILTCTPDDFTLWVDRVPSGEGYRGIEVNAQADTVTGLTLRVRQSVCTNKGEGMAWEA